MRLLLGLQPTRVQHLQHHREGPAHAMQLEGGEKVGGKVSASRTFFRMPAAFIFIYYICHYGHDRIHDDLPA